MRLGDPFADGEAEPSTRALARARARRVGAPEAVEDMGQIAGGDADAGVCNREYGPPVVRAELDRDLSATRRVLHGVFDEVQRELTDAAPVHREHEGLRRQADVDADSGVFGEQLPGLSRLRNDVAQI